MNWNVKAQAYLYAASRAATALGDDRDAFAERLLRAANLDPVPQSPDRDLIREAEQWALGLDLPPLTGTPLTDWRRHGLIHPLSGDRITVPGPDPDAADCLEALAIQSQQAVTRLRPDANAQARFLSLWAALPGDLSSILGVLPADPHILVPTVWHHAAMTSAIAGCNGDPAFLSFTIASPQDFVSTSRRTQDFWMGSFLLSYLSWRAMRVVAERCGPDALIYPDLRAQPLVDLWLKERNVPVGNPTEDALKIANFPNRFTAVVPWEQARALGEAAAEAIRHGFRDVAGLCLNALITAVRAHKDTPWGRELAGVGGEAWSGIWNRHAEGLGDSLGMYWSAVRWDRRAPSLSPLEAFDAALAEHEWLFPGKKSPVGSSENSPVRSVQKAFGTANLGMAYAPLSRLSALSLDTRKNLRNFTNRPEGEPGEKCSLCGIRQALHPDGEVPASELRSFWNKLRDVSVRSPRKFKLRGRLKRGERLCGVCLTRRMAWEHAFVDRYFEGLVDPDEAHLLFPSAATIATAPFKQAVLGRLTNGETAAAVRLAVARYVDAMQQLLKRGRTGSDSRDDHLLFWSPALPRLHRDLPGKNSPEHLFLRLDGSWLYEESFDPASLEQEYPGEHFDAGARESALAALKALLALIPVRPSRYFALIFMDGDDMGAWISGQPRKATGSHSQTALLYEQVVHPDASNALPGALTNQPRPLSGSGHRALSASLKHFALDVAREVVEEHHLGKLVYAGGDDVAALAPISDLLPVLRDLRRGFSGEDTPATDPVDPTKPGLVAVSGGRWVNLAGRTFTASTGVAIVHHSHPFSHAMESGFAAMKDHAKARVGRDGFAIHLFKRGGTPLRWGEKWRFEHGADRIESLAVLDTLAGAFGDEPCLSAGLPYALARVQSGLGSWGSGAARTETLAVAASTLLRSLLRRHGDSKQREQVDQIHGQLEQLLHHWYDTLDTKSGPSPPPWERLRDLLLLARFLAGQEADA